MESNSLLVRNLKFTAANLRKQWKVFYKSPFGKVGFYLLVGFIVIALIAPLLAHGNPFASIPAEDYFTSSVVLNHHLPDHISTSSFSITGSQSDESDTVGTYYLFSTGFEKGGLGLLALSTKNGTEQKLFPIDGVPYNVTSFSAYNIGGLAETFVTVATEKTIYVDHVICKFDSFTGSSSISSGPVESLNVSNTSSITMSDYSSAKDYSTSSPSGGIGQYFTNSLGFPNVYLYATTRNSTGIYLNEYCAFNLHLLWSNKLNFTPTSMQFYGQCFIGNTYNDHALIFAFGSNAYSAYYLNGTSAFNYTFLNSISQYLIPKYYQYDYVSSNVMFISSGKSVYEVKLSSGAVTDIFNSGNLINTISTSSGSNGFPGYFLVSSGHNILVLEEAKNSTKLVVNNNVTLPYEVNFIEYYKSGEFLLVNTTSGNLLLMIQPMSQYPFLWHSSVGKPISDPIIFTNPWQFNKTIGYAPNIAFLNGENFTMYGLGGFDLNPMPPTFHTLSGQGLPLGTNLAGNSVWTIFIDSFPTDLEVGFAAGIFTVVISVLFSMVIGYYRGILSSLGETFALAVFLIPGLPLFIVLATVLGPSLVNLILIFSLLGWPFAAFTLIGIVRSIKARTFVDSAVVSNISTLGILRRHVLPNMAPLLVYLTAINIGGSVAAVSTYEILGLAPLDIPTWGGILNGFLGDYFSIGLYPWILIPAIAALTLFILCFIFIARGLDEVANPRVRSR